MPCHSNSGSLVLLALNLLGTFVSLWFWMQKHLQISPFPICGYPSAFPGKASIEKNPSIFLLPGKDEWFIVLKTFSGEKHLKTNTYSTFSKSVNSDQPKKSGFNMNQCTCPIRPHKEALQWSKSRETNRKARLKSKDYNGGFVFTKKHLWSFM